MLLFFRFFYFFLGLEFLYLFIIFSFEFYRLYGLGFYHKRLNDNKIRKRVLKEIVIDDFVN